MTEIASQRGIAPSDYAAHLDRTLARERAWRRRKRRNRMVRRMLLWVVAWLAVCAGAWIVGRGA